MDAPADDKACDRCTGTLIAILLVLIIIIMAYRMGWLNWALPASWRLGCKSQPKSHKQKFVGNWSRTDQGKPTLIYASSNARWPLVNLGTYV